MQLIAIVTKDPAQLPQASEELILESKANISLYPDSPGGSNSQGGCSNSLGSRKSSVCSISSINSSSSGSPGHHQFQRSLSQVSATDRLKSMLKFANSCVILHPCCVAKKARKSCE